jgi:predicted RNA-binding Zn-ribbon protein involved in translation (DUF1610 family)
MNCTNCGKENVGDNRYCWNCGSKLDVKEEPNTKITFITLSCPSCGGKLQITNDMNRFACGHCGNEHIVRRSGGTISLTPVVEGLRKVQSGVDKTASELAIVRLKKEIEELEEECDDLENDLSNKRYYWTLALVILALFVLISLMIQQWFFVIILAILAVGALIGRQQVRDDGQIAKDEERLDKCESELKHHKKIVQQL